MSKNSIENPVSFQERLRVAIEDNNIRPIDLANMTGIPKSMISNYLSGRYVPKSDRLYTLACALGVNEAWLLGYDVPKGRTEDQKKNDDLVKVVAKLRNDPAFFDFVRQLAELKPEEYEGLKVIVSALRNK